MLFKAPGLQKCADDDRVAEEHDYKRKAEAHADLQGQHQDLSPVVFIVPVDQSAEGRPFDASLHLGEDELREGQESGEQPDTQAGKFAVEQALFLQVLGFGDLYYRNVAVHADAGEQKHAAEEVDFIGSGHHFAETGAKVPALDGFNGPEGQHAQEQQVSHSQV